MAILWLIIGFLIGLAVAWYYLGGRTKMLSGEGEAEASRQPARAKRPLHTARTATGSPSCKNRSGNGTEQFPGWKQTLPNAGQKRRARQARRLPVKVP